MGWIADRVGRVLTISVACLVWSACSMIGALSASFLHLAVARAGVAIGETGGTAPSYAIISARCSRNLRGSALGLFHVGSPGSAFIGVAISAWVAGTFGWRAALVAVSVPGLVMAAVLLLLVREPPRTRAEEGAVPSLAA